MKLLLQLIGLSLLDYYLEFLTCLNLDYFKWMLKVPSWMTILMSKFMLSNQKDFLS